MDREALRTVVHEVARFSCNLATEQQQSLERTEDIA